MLRAVTVGCSVCWAVCHAGGSRLCDGDFLRRRQQGGPGNRLLQAIQGGHGNAVVHGSYNGDLDKLKRMVEVSHVSWDVVEVEAPELARGCQEGLFEKLDQR
jgi:spermidine/putrescine-binding protein